MVLYTVLERPYEIQTSSKTSTNTHKRLAIKTNTTLSSLSIRPNPNLKLSSREVVLEAHSSHATKDSPAELVSLHQWKANGPLLQCGNVLRAEPDLRHATIEILV